MRYPLIHEMHSLPITGECIALFLAATSTRLVGYGRIAADSNPQLFLFNTPESRT